MRDRILLAIEGCQADYTEIRLEREWRTQVLYRGSNLENLETSTELGGIVRCLAEGGWGIAVFNSLDQLEERVEDAYRIARLVGQRTVERVELAPVEPIQDEVRVSLERGPRSVPLPQKQALIEAFNDIMLTYSPKIVTTEALYFDSFKEITLATSGGTYIVEERPDVGLRLAATARQEDNNLQTAFETGGWAAGLDNLEGAEKAEKTAQRALELLQAKPVKGGNYTVILDHFLVGVFIHEAFGHLCEADSLIKNPRLLQILRPGRRFGPDELNVIDEGFLPGRRGNYRYDDEGVPRSRTYLIQDGLLQGYLHNRETAARLGVEPTGNARAFSYQYEPIVRMRNTYVDRGTATFAQMLQETDRGIYACGSAGGQTQTEQFTFSAAYAYEIVNGQIGDMLRDVVLSGNIFDTLKKIERIGDDLLIKGGSGGCGKGRQYPLPVTFGGPHIRIRDVTIGGKAR